MSVAGAIDRVVPILHSGPGCGLQASIGTTVDYLGGGTGCPSTNTYEKEVIFGGETRLRETIQGAVEVMDADLYVVLTGCTAGIIGDDIKSIADEFAEEGVPIVAVETAGFKGDTYFGYTATLLAIIRKLAKKTETEPHTVNLYGLVPSLDNTSFGDIEELTRVLGRIGVKVNSFFYQRDGLEQLENSGNAALNINLSPWFGGNIDAYYKTAFGIPTLHYPGFPVGPTATSDFLRQVGSALGINPVVIEDAVDQEEDYVYRYFQRAARELYRYAVVGDANTVLGLSRYLTNDVGYKANVAIVTDNVPEAKKEAIRQELSSLEYGKPPVIYFEDDRYNIAQLLKTHAQDINLILGSSYEREISNELGIFFVTVSYPDTDHHILNKTHVGYRGSLTIIEDMYNNL
jgi:nitrogenase molybdenum-iron protein beta chain